MNEVKRFTGTKKDAGKLRWGLVPWAALREIVAVLTHGAKKYAPDNWKHVPGARDRYFDAMMRHVDAWWGGDPIDDEWGCHHLAHAGCCLLFLLWFEVVGPYPPDDST